MRQRAEPDAFDAFVDYVTARLKEDPHLSAACPSAPGRSRSHRNTVPGGYVTGRREAYFRSTWTHGFMRKSVIVITAGACLEIL